jgi:hypothetical protein
MNLDCSKLKSTSVLLIYIQNTYTEAYINRAPKIKQKLDRA